MNLQEKLRRLRNYLKQVAPQEDIESLTEEPLGLEGMSPVLTGAEEDVNHASEGIRKIARGETPEAVEMWSLEAIVLPRQRPAVDIVRNSYNNPPPPWTHFGEGKLRANIEAAILSIGRIELPNHPSILYGGTGFVVADRLIMTNRHVAETFATGVGLRDLHFRPGQTAAMNFRHEVFPAGSIHLYVRDVVMIHPFWDMALLLVEGLPEAQVPLRLSILHPDDFVNQDVAVIGYPTQDGRNDPDLQNRIFGGKYNVKRLQPGKARVREGIRSYNRVVDAMTHDSSTLGGNSGSAVIDVVTGEVIGLHFAGVYLKANYAVPTYELARDKRVVDSGVQFSGSLEPSDACEEAWAEADSKDEPGAVKDVAPTLRSCGFAGRSAILTTEQPAVWTIPLQVSVVLGTPVRVDVGDAAPAAPTEAPRYRIQPDIDYEKRSGYDPKFLGEEFPIPLPWLNEDQYANVAFNRWATSQRHVLPYHHFSIVMNRERSLAYFTAVNIDGRREKDISREDFSDRWFVDPRIGEHEQLQNDLYAGNPLDRGHLVRRLDPVWGTRFADAKKAHDDTFHWTNCSPQHEKFNRNKSTWGLVEDWILRSAHAMNQRVTVFTGPVFRENDPVFQTRSGNRVKLPLQFWKVVIALKQEGTLSATAYLVSQDRLIDDLLEAVREPRSFQTSVREIERLTGLSFHDLRDHDPSELRSLETTGPWEIEILSSADIVLE